MTFRKIAREGIDIQIISLQKHSPEAHEVLKSIRENSPAEVYGTLQIKEPKKSDSGQPLEEPQLEILLDDITSLNEFPADILTGPDAVYGADQRHLQIRFTPLLQQRLKFRHEILQSIRGFLSDFREIETPILFKSTPEGAREFLVPTRKPGYSYALPQSPQQYKQMLMASGIHRYFQVARCFRDEDLRADRQPEFTQLDMEMAFASGEDVMQRMEALILDIFEKRKELWPAGKHEEFSKPPFRRMKYEEAMLRHGVDKPDLRIKELIYQVEAVVPDNLKGMMTSLEDPVIDAVKFNLDCSPKDVRKFVGEVLDAQDMKPFHTNPDGPPGVFIYDPTKPLEGLQAWGYEGHEAIHNFYESVGTPLEPGDVILAQPRPRARLSGGSTTLGKLRTHIHRLAVSQNLIEKDANFHLLWVVDFPLFTPTSTADSASGEGQGGLSGFSATHHPFTAPKTPADVDKLFTDPLAVTADHYDLVLNGVELGGGSSRIHSSPLQQYIMRHILQMPEERVRDFDHLFECLRAGCPPHAGIALGLDRLVATLTGTESIRDVLAWPKNGKGVDEVVGCPTRMTERQLGVYHLEVTGEVEGKNE
jgi:aspartyl-tRNA synthetase